MTQRMLQTPFARPSYACSIQTAAVGGGGGDDGNDTQTGAVVVMPDDDSKSAKGRMMECEMAHTTRKETVGRCEWPEQAQ